MTPEQIVQSQILAYLKTKQIWHRRFNTGRRAGVTFGSVGLADILCTPDGNCSDEGCCYVPLLVWLEVKGKNGKQSEAQKDFEFEVFNSGHKYFVVRSVEDVEQALKGLL